MTLSNEFLAIGRTIPIVFVGISDVAPTLLARADEVIE
jgi:hypothetical protein